MGGKWGKWAMAAVLIFSSLPIAVGAETVIEERTVSPFVASYREETHRAGDFGEVYHLSGGVAAYRLTPDTDPASDGYHRENLESHTARSQQIRAVLLGGYPKESLVSLTEKASRFLEENGLPPIVRLQEGEAILATQLAIWDVPVEEYVSGWKYLSGSRWRNYPGNTLVEDGLTEYSAWNVEGLCRYLGQLPPCSPQKETVCDDALEQEAYLAEKSGDTYRITAKVRIRGDITGEDALTLTATCAGQSKLLLVTQPGSFEVVFEGMEEKLPVTVEVSGRQSGGDVYAFQSGKACLVGWDERSREVKGKVDIEPDRILSLTRSTQGEGAEYKVYLAVTREELENGTRSPEGTPTAEEIARYQTPENLVAVLWTDKDGQAQYNFTAQGDPEGIYLVVESNGSGVPVEPFYVAMLGQGYERQVDLQTPTETAMELSVNIDRIGMTQNSVSAGQQLLWIARSTLPTGLAGAGSFSLRLDPAEGLEWDKESVSVSLFNGVEELPMVEQVHYLLDGKDGISVSLTPAGMAYGAAQQKETMPELRIRFPGTVSAFAALGTPLTCRVQGEYRNAAGIRFSVTGEEATVSTGGLAIRKTEPGGKAVAGASFSLARPAQPGEENAQPLMVGKEEQQVVYVTFLTTRDGTGEMTAAARTDSDGRAWLTGLAYGVYYLVEEGQNPVAVTVDALSHMDGSDGMPDHTLVLVAQRSLLPHTGDPGIQLLTAIGSAALILACTLTLHSRKRSYRHSGV